MLGSLIYNHRWSWTAVGKHPTAGDYIKLHDGSTLLDAVMDWMVKGYDAINRQKQQSNSLYSWRFWLRGPKKGSLICGMGRDSSDRIGRPFPILIMGEGVLKGLEQQWPLLPLQLAEAWRAMEFIAAHRYDNINDLTAAVSTLPTPKSNIKVDQIIGQQDNAVEKDQLNNCGNELRHTGRTMITLNDPNDDADDDPSRAAWKWHVLLKRISTEIPRAVFLGGTPQNTYMMVTQLPLSTEDFVRLWTIS